LVSSVNRSLDERLMPHMTARRRQPPPPREAPLPLPETKPARRHRVLQPHARTSSQRRSLRDTVREPVLNLETAVLSRDRRAHPPPAQDRPDQETGRRLLRKKAPRGRSPEIRRLYLRSDTRSPDSTPDAGTAPRISFHFTSEEK